MYFVVVEDGVACSTGIEGNFSPTAVSATAAASCKILSDSALVAVSIPNEESLPVKIQFSLLCFLLK